MNNYEGVKLFECLICGVVWVDVWFLKCYVRIYIGEWFYVCFVCSEVYIDVWIFCKYMIKFYRDYVFCKIMLEKDIF